MSGTGAALPAVVSEVLPNARFRCRAEDGREIVCHVSGEARLKLVRLLPGDRIWIEPSPVDPGKGRITGKAGRQGS